ncbi:MAG: hypothetical protein H7199_11290 [Burkholderiales bacterium]|nr:hypothetical protein [Flavobacterium sp.]
MKKNYFILGALFILSVMLHSCSNDEDSDYITINAETGKDGGVTTAPVKFDMAQVPLPKLSDYHFFIGLLRNQKPGYLVLPYEPASSLFSDYAHKKRFVWMPKGTHASYNGDDNVLNFPVGAVLIKTFYYDNVQPSNTTKIIETRLLIRKNDGWKLYDYVWNESQTEAYLDTEGNGIFIPVTWTENNITKSTTYKIPSQTECTTCHKINPNQTGEISIPIGPKPQNLNTVYNYGNVYKNQLQRWKSVGYIDSSLPATSSIYSTVDWKDTNKSLALRARSYIDINCAHCHRDGGHCDYVAQRFNFSNTDMNLFGVCLVPLFTIEDNPYIINAGNSEHSELIYRLNSTEGAVMMPIIGRTLIHEEGVQLIRDWINSLPNPCQ